MAFFEEPLPETLHDRLLAAAENDPSIFASTHREGGAVTLHESFEIWLLEGGIDPHRGLEPAVRSYLWHHQIEQIVPDSEGRERQLPVLAIISSFEGDEARIHAVDEDVRVLRIAQAIRWLDRHIPEEVPTRFLQLPAYGVAAFWLRGNSERLVAADGPAGFLDSVFGQPLPPEPFLARVSELPILGGLARGDGR